MPVQPVTRPNGKLRPKKNVKPFIKHVYASESLLICAARSIVQLGQEGEDRFYEHGPAESCSTSALKKISTRAKLVLVYGNTKRASLINHVSPSQKLISSSFQSEPPLNPKTPSHVDLFEQL